MKKLIVLIVLIALVFIISCKKKKLYTCSVKYTEAVLLTTNEGDTFIRGGETFSPQTNNPNYCEEIDAVYCECELN